MSDEANNPEGEIAVEAETEAPEAPEVIEAEDTPLVEVESGEPEVQDQASEDTETEQPPEAAELVNVEYDGTEYEVPAKLKDALLRQSDYTTKTQALATERKALEAQSAAFQQQQELNQQTFDDVAQVKAIDQQIEQYNALNWDELYQQDVAQAASLARQKDDLKEQRAQTITRLEHNKNQVLNNQRVEHARVVEEGQKVLKNEIENWSPELAQTIATYGVSQGLDERAVASIVDPVHVKLIDKARRYDELVAKQKAAKPVAEPPKAAIKVKGKRANPTKDPDKLSMDEWLKMRDKEIEKKRRSA